MKRVMTVVFAGLLLSSLALLAGCDESSAEDEAKMDKRPVPTEKRQAPGPGGGGSMEEAAGEAVDRPEDEE